MEIEVIMKILTKTILFYRTYSGLFVKKQKQSSFFRKKSNQFRLKENINDKTKNSGKKHDFCVRPAYCKVTKMLAQR